MQVMRLNLVCDDHALRKKIIHIISFESKYFHEPNVKYEVE